MTELPKLRVERNWLAIMSPRGPRWEVNVTHPVYGYLTYASFMAWRDAYDWAHHLAMQITERLEAK